jgi:hypothetical protein
MARGPLRISRAGRVPTVKHLGPPDRQLLFEHMSAFSTGAALEHAADKARRAAGKNDTGAMDRDGLFLREDPVGRKH